jgi:hypothetical protein
MPPNREHDGGKALAQRALPLPLSRLSSGGNGYGRQGIQPLSPALSQPAEVHVAPVQAAPVAVLLDHARPDQARPAQATSDQARPDQARPDQARPAQFVWPSDGGAHPVPVHGWPIQAGGRAGRRG